MIEFVITAIAVVLVFILLSFARLKIKTKILAQVVIVSFLIVTLTYLVYELYSFYYAVAAFFLVTLIFSYIIGKQIDFAKGKEYQDDTSLYDEFKHADKVKEIENMREVSDKEEIEIEAETKGVPDQVDHQLLEQENSDTEKEALVHSDDVKHEMKLMEGNTFGTNKEIEDMYNAQPRQRLLDEEDVKEEETDVHTLLPRATVEDEWRQTTVEKQEKTVTKEDDSEEGKEVESDLIRKRKQLFAELENELFDNKK